MLHRKLALLTVIAIFVLVAAMPVVAQEDDAVVVIPAGETVQIGFAASLSGEVIPEAGEDMRNAAQLAVDQFNAENDIEGFAVELLAEDDQCAPEQATSVANLFTTEPNLVGVVGHMCSGATGVAAQVYDEAMIVNVSPSATNGTLTQQGYEYFSRVIGNDDAQGTVVGRYIAEELGAEVLAVVHDNSDYGKGLAETVAAIAAENGVEVLDIQAIDPAEQDYRPVLTVLAGEEPDVLYFGGYQNEAALLVTQMKEVGMEDTIFFSDDGVKIQAFIDLAGDAAEGAYVSLPTSIGVSEEANAEFDALYEEVYGLAPDDLGPFHAQAYDAANVIINAIQSVAELDEDGNLVIDRVALSEVVRATTDYEGLSGMISCGETGECAGTVISVSIVEDGEFVDVEVPAELQVN